MGDGGGGRESIGQRSCDDDLGEIDDRDHHLDLSAPRGAQLPIEFRERSVPAFDPTDRDPRADDDHAHRLAASRTRSRRRSRGTTRSGIIA